MHQPSKGAYGLTPTKIPLQAARKRQFYFILFILYKSKRKLSSSFIPILLASKGIMYFGNQNKTFSNMYFIVTILTQARNFYLHWPCSIINPNISKLLGNGVTSVLTHSVNTEEQSCGMLWFWGIILLIWSTFEKNSSDTILESVNISRAWVQQMHSKAAHQSKICMFKNILN